MSRFLIFILLGKLAVLIGAAPVFSTENIFPLGAKHVHSSSIVECKDGSLLVCWFHGSGERRADDVLVQGARLQHGSRQWGEVFVMADTPGFPDCNPVLFVDSKERLWLYWITVLANRWECSQLKYLRADQTSGSGVPKWNWQGLIQLKPGDRFRSVMADRFDELGVDQRMWAEFAKPYEQMLLEAASDPYKRQTGWMTRTHPLTLPSGRILLPLYSDGFNASLMGISDDHGETWRASSPIIGLGPIQPTVALQRNGTLVAYCRDSGSLPQRVLRSESTDEGETWSAAIDTDIPNPGSSLEVTTLKDGRWLMICNDTEKGRHRLSALLSSDEGKSWGNKRVIEPSDVAGTGFGYPSVIQSRDGFIHLTYSYASVHGKSIRHSRFNLEWMSAQKH